MEMKKINFNDLKNEQYLKFYKFLFDEQFVKLSDSAKILYTVLRDRLNLTLSNIEKGDKQWIDKDGNVFIKAGLENIMQFMDCAKEKAVKLKKELVKFGLIQDVRIGVNKSNRIYIMQVNYLETLDNTLKFENRTSRSSKIELQEVRKSNSNKNNTNKTYYNNNNNDNNNIPNIPSKNPNVVVKNQNKIIDSKEKKNTELKINTIDEETAKQIQQKFQEVTQGKIKLVNVKEIILKKDTNLINKYLNNIDKFTIDKNPVGFMKRAILEEWDIPEKKISSTYQRKKYEADKYYDDIDVEALETDPKEIKL